MKTKIKSIIKSLFGSLKTEKQIELNICEKEYDSPELSYLLSWLKKNNWSIKEIDWTLAGSQELTTYEISNNEKKAYLLFETYQGVTLIASKEMARDFYELEIKK